MLNFSELIISKRKLNGWTHEYVAQQVGLSLSEYMDIEAYEDEFIEVIKIDVLMKICRLFHINLEKELLKDLGEPKGKLDSIEQVCQLVNTYITEKKISIDEFETAVGWTFVDDLNNGNFITNNCIMVIIDLGNLMGLDWQHLLIPFVK